MPTFTAVPVGQVTVVQSLICALVTQIPTIVDQTQVTTATVIFSGLGTAFA